MRPRRRLPERLTPKQARFVAEYLVDLSATQAAVRAGYSKKTADVQGPRLLGDVRIKKALAKGQMRQLEKAELTADRVLEELRRVAFADIREFFDLEGNIKPVHKLTVEQASQLANLEVTRQKAKGNGVVAVFRIRLWDKLNALELLAKHFALLTDVSEIRISGRLTVEQVGQMSDGELAERLPLARPSQISSMQHPRPIHPFPARMAASIPWEELDVHHTSGPVTVLDPMAGSGTTVVVGRTLGHRTIGFDLDPLAVLIASTWCADLDSILIFKAAERVLNGTPWSKLPDGLAYPPNADEDTKVFVRYWFDRRNRKQLAVLSSRIARVRDHNVRAALWCALSRLIITKQVGVSLAMDVSHSRPHRVYDEAPLDAFDGFLPAVGKVLAAAPFAAPHPRGPQSVVMRGDARALPLGDGSIDVVITSPPYLNAIDYLRGHRMSLVWMRHALAKLRMIRSTSVGSEVAGRIDATLTPTLTAMGGDRLATRQRGMLFAYLRDMRAVVGEIARVLKPGGRAVIVIGDCAIRGTFIENSIAIERLAASAGLRALGRNVRDLPENRRYLPPPTHGDAGDQLQKRMRQEVILTFEAA